MRGGSGGPGELVEQGTGKREQETGKSAASVDGEAPAISFLAMDVSFISATLVVESVVLRALVPMGVVWRGEAVVLVGRG